MFDYRKPVTDDVNWPLYTKEQPQYFIFNAEKNGIGRGPRADACAFWNHFLPKVRENSGKFFDLIICVLSSRIFYQNRVNTLIERLSRIHRYLLEDILLPLIYQSLSRNINQDSG